MTTRSSASVMPPELERRSDALAERVKELRCLHSISGLLRGRHELSDILQKVVDVIPAAWQYPELAQAALTLKSRRYQSRGFRTPRWAQQAAPIVVDGQQVGTLELGYVDALPDGGQPEFLAEEQVLLATVAERLAEIVALKEAQNQLATYQEHLRSLASELTLTEERERRTLALHLHDRIGQGLALARLKMETLKHLVPAEHQARADDLSALLKQIVSDTRSLTFEISPPILYELGLRQAVLWLGEHLEQQSGLRVEVRGDDELVPLTEGVQVMLFRSIQELLTNTMKHAQASRATVRLLNDADELCVIVEDDGVGFDAASLGRLPSAAGGFGLFSLRERIGHLGGRVQVDSTPGKGTRVQLSVPSADGREDTGSPGGARSP
ncbi:MAG: sensor histidine kinase [Myxococcales bacterium]